MAIYLIKRSFLVFTLIALAGVINVAPARADGWDFRQRVTHVPILMYHYISAAPENGDRYVKDLAVTPENFEAQVQWLHDQGYTSITPDDLIAALWRGQPLPPKPIMFTFDDGYIDAYANAFPILKTFGYTGTFFIVTDWLDENKVGYINWDMARAMVQGGMSVQSHSRSHDDFRRRSHEWYVDQIAGSLNAIEKHTGVRPKFFCYPYGGYDNVAIRELQAAGIVAAFTENDSRYEYASNTMRLPRVRVRGSMTLRQFIRTVGDSR
jgi:peptidoglycan/xylan/chitin deacetylase (PgdA/CDA1 family)